MFVNASNQMLFWEMIKEDKATEASNLSQWKSPSTPRPTKISSSSRENQNRAGPRIFPNNLYLKLSERKCDHPEPNVSRK